MATSSARILILSDTHGSWPYSPSNPAPSNLDVFIHCGDLTQVGGLASIKRAVEDIKTIDAELKLIIAGNHDLELDEAWVRKNLEDDEELLEEHQACIEYMQGLGKDIHYLTEGVHNFMLKSGAKLTVYATPYTPEFNGYAFGYGPEENRFDSAPIPEHGGDIVISHGPPRFESANYQLDVNRKGELCGCPKLAKAIATSKPRMHCFGHIHEGRGAALMRWEDGTIVPMADDESELMVGEPSGRTETLLINAAMDGDRVNGRLVSIALPL